MNKYALRQFFLEKRRAISKQEKAVLDNQMLQQFIHHFPQPIDQILCYYPIEKKHEPNVLLIANYLKEKNPNLRLSFPKIAPSTNLMEAIEIATITDSFVENKWAIYEPKEVNFLVAKDSLKNVLVPLLAVDKKGNRVGYGKGFYDKFLAAQNKDTLKIGLGYFDPVEKIDDINSFDIPINFYITPSKVYEFK